MCGGGKSLEEVFHVFMDQRVFTQMIIEIIKLLCGRQCSVQKQVGDFNEA